MSLAFGPLIDDIPYALIGTSQRSIGTIIPNCAIEEIHRDEMQITQHPIEAGAPVTDHAFVFLSTVELRWGWSDSSEQAVGWVKTVYNMLLALQRSRSPFNVSTGKRLYSNMLCRSLQIRTDGASEFALMGLAICQQIYITTSSGGGAQQKIGGPSPGPIGEGAQPGAPVYANGITGIPANSNIGFGVPAGVNVLGTPVPTADGSVLFPAGTNDTGTAFLMPGGPVGPSFITNPAGAATP